MKLHLLLLFILVALGYCDESVCYHETVTQFPICTIHTILSEEAHSPTPSTQYKAIEIGYLRQPVVLETLPWYLYYGAKTIVGNGELVIGPMVMYTHEPTSLDMMGNDAIYSSGRNVIVRMSNYRLWNSIVAKILHWIINDWQRVEKTENPFLDPFDYVWIHELIDKVGDGHIGGSILAGADVILSYTNGDTLKLHVNDHLNYEKSMTPQQFARVAIYFKKSAFVSTSDSTLKNPIDRLT